MYARAGRSLEVIPVDGRVYELVQGGYYFRSSREGDVALGLVSWATVGLARVKLNHMPTLVAIHQFSLTRIVSNIFRGNDLATGSNSLEIAAVVHGAH